MPRVTLYTCTNQTRHTVVATHVKKADTYWLRLMGLLPKKRLGPGEGLWIVPCKDIHSIGMRFLFDAVFLDKQGQVVHLIEAMRPLRVSPLIKQAHSVLELEAGALAAAQVKLGDLLTFDETLA